MPQNKPVIAAFDFDGTISKKDTFFPFLIFVFGRLVVYRAVLKAVASLPSRPFTLSVRDYIKASLVKILFKDKRIDYIQKFAFEYSSHVYSYCLKKQALERLRWHQAQNHHCVMVSASLSVYLALIAHHLGFDSILSTQLVDNSVFYSGELQSGNCRAKNKVTQLTNHFGDLTQYEIYAYGDSAGDKEMLQVSNYPHYRNFKY